MEFYYIKWVAAGGRWSFNIEPVEGAIRVPFDYGMELLNGGNSGMEIYLNEDGWPMLRPRIEPFEPQAVALMADVRAKREAIFNRLALIAIIAYSDNDMVVFNAIKAGRQALLDLPQHPSVVDATNITDLRAAVKSLYADIVAAVPPSLKQQFDEVDM